MLPDAAGQEIPALAELHKPREAHIRPEADLDTSQDKRGEKLGTGGRGKPTRLVGRRLAKRFGRKTYYGTVLAWNAAMRHFRVKYDDSDAEDLSREEARATAKPPSKLCLALSLPFGAFPPASSPAPFTKSQLEALLIPEGPGEPEPPAKRRKAAAAGSGKTNKAVDGTGDRAANADGRLQRSEPCLALSGFHTDTKRHYTDVIHRLGASKSRKSDLHAWDKEVGAEYRE